MGRRGLTTRGQLLGFYNQTTRCLLSFGILLDLE